MGITANRVGKHEIGSKTYACEVICVHDERVLCKALEPVVTAGLLVHEICNGGFCSRTVSMDSRAVIRIACDVIDQLAECTGESTFRLVLYRCLYLILRG